MEINDYKNINVLLQTGKWDLNAQGSQVLLGLIEKINQEIKLKETPKEEN